MKKNDKFKNYLPYLILAVVVVFCLSMLSMQGSKVNELKTGELISYLKDDKVSEIIVTPNNNEQVYIIEGKLDDYEKNESFKTKVVSEQLKNVIDLIDENNIKKYETNSDASGSPLLYIVINVLPFVILIFFGYMLFKKLAQSNKNSVDFGRSRARLSNDNDKKKFKDVAGLTEEKKEVEELIDFLKNPKKFQKLGARIPKGVLLVGPPGTGKTLLAKAVAGEADVPFFYISGSDFVELFVGVGASRVRDMFKEAKRNAPCLIFIDEIDAVGRQRGTGLGGGHDEREQTLNQLLTEMDGFGENEGIIIIAATNRPDVLDPALLRPGRFDRQVTINLPDARSREEILKVHARNKILDKTVTLKNLSERTPGFSGADLENLLNEAALLAVRRDKESISMDEIDEATDRVLMGPAKTSKQITEKEKKLVSIHEAGHAVIGIKLEDANEVHKITIIPRGVAGGYTMMLPKEEKMLVATKKEIVSQITGLLGGRVAEEMFLGEISTGASDDFKRATNLARSMVCEYGMSDLGPIQYEEKQEGVFLGRDYGKQKNFSDKVAHEIDEEIRKIINTCYDNAKNVLKNNEKLINLLSDALMKYETLTKEQIEYIVKNENIDLDNIHNNIKETETDDSEEKLLREKAKQLKIKGYTKMSLDELKTKIEEEEGK